VSISSAKLLALEPVIDHLETQRQRPRKPPSQARARHTVDAIIEAAARILEELGFSGYTTNAVAARAGVSIGTLYQYFPDKDALVGALIDRETTRFVDEVESAAMARSARDALGAVIRAAVGHQARRPRLARLLDFEEARLPLDAEIQRVRTKFAVILSGVLDRQDLPRQADISTATSDVAAIVRGMVDDAGERGEIDQKGLARRVERAVLGYLAMPTGS
jgi:AcrR family transcriptional regulator